MRKSTAVNTIAKKAAKTKSAPRHSEFLLTAEITITSTVAFYAFVRIMTHIIIYQNYSYCKQNLDLTRQVVYNNIDIKGDFMNIEVKGINICYDEAGEGRDVLLLHGWGANKESLSPIFNALKDEFHVLALDMPGCGASEEMSAAWSVSDYSDFLKEFIEKTGISPYAALGHSNGGRVLIRASSDWFCPEKLILVDAAGIMPKRKPSYYIKVYSYKLGKKVLGLPGIKNTGLYEKFQKNAGSEDYRNSSPVMRATMSRLVNEDLTDCLEKIGAETLLIWGECDTATPIADGKKMERLIKGSGLVEIKGAGHFSYLENPKVALGAIKYFLNA